jgi:hypothetical protein
MGVSILIIKKKCTASQKKRIRSTNALLKETAGSLGSTTAGPAGLEVGLCFCR